MSRSYGGVGLENWGEVVDGCMTLVVRGMSGVRVVLLYQNVDLQKDTSKKDCWRYRVYSNSRDI